MPAPPDKSTRLLVVEQDRRYGEWLRQHLGVLCPESLISVLDFREFEHWSEELAARECDILLLSSDFGAGPEDPRATGLEQLRRLRSRRRKPAIIAVAEGGNELTAVRALHLGAIDYLPKRLLTPERLATSLRLALRRLARKEARRLLQPTRTQVVPPSAVAARASRAAQPTQPEPAAPVSAPLRSGPAPKATEAELPDDTDTALDAVGDLQAQAILEGNAVAGAARSAVTAAAERAAASVEPAVPGERPAFLPYGLSPLLKDEAPQPATAATGNERPPFLPYGSDYVKPAESTDTISTAAPLAQLAGNAAPSAHQPGDEASEPAEAAAAEAALHADAAAVTALAPTVPPDFLPGYTIHGIVGESEKATVYVASSHALGHKVAVKVSKTLRDDTAGRQFLEREYRAIVAIRHPAVVRIFDYGVHGGFEFLVMEYLPLGDLKARMQQGVSEQDALFYLQQIAVGLRVVHHAGLLHRDLKPPNVMLRAGGEVALIDFGLARALDGSTPSTRVGVLRGSPYYMSPEQAQGEPLDVRSDFYSLGIIFFELLTGTKPYTGATAMDVLQQHVSAPLPQLPQSLAHHQPLLARLLAKVPAERFGSATEIIDTVTTTREISEVAPSAA
ncbi:MAG: protein kinase [Sinobacteraceae bacterium]|nr:protein kinase [Nevskiaceae bacterium]